ncbi:lysozyme [Streptomyces sp. NPDC050439]|uniref:lysozyme n=1 Tax=unclassified Streptomyces TaxID=2593676 RepID=UPI00342A5996
MARDRTPSHRRARVIAASVTALALGAAALAEIPVSAAGKPRGHDVSSHQKNVDWQQARSKGAQFVYVKATESHTYRSPSFRRQYDGSRAAGLLRGAYHFALPDKSSGRRQAAYFMEHGGRWRADGRTLPPALDIEHNPYGPRKCYGLGSARMVDWIKAFSGEVKRQTGRRPVIYTTTKWWNACTGGSRVFGSDHALWLARWASTPGALPKGWSRLTVWQHDNAGALPGDQNLFNGSANTLRSFARG